jgi:hypothetical protein
MGEDKITVTLVGLVSIISTCFAGSTHSQKCRSAAKSCLVSFCVQISYQLIVGAWRISGQYAVLMGGRITCICLFLLVNIRDDFLSVSHLTSGTWYADVTELLSFFCFSSSVKLCHVDSRCEFSYFQSVVYCAWLQASAVVWMKCPFFWILRCVVRS